jgi:uncharacterized protein (DUF2252 family)
MAVKRVAHPSVEERTARGKDARTRTPRSTHAGWKPATDRPDPVGLLERQDATREPDLVPVRHGRMMVSPFTFYRGAAKIMATDLKDTPRAGLDVQLCGDAHLSNFGLFGSPERRLLLALNDFDETLPGPFEYDVKRMAASFRIAARNNGFSKADARSVTQASVTGYREAMAGFAGMGTLEVWYASLSEDILLNAARGAAKTMEAKEVKRASIGFEKARMRDSLQALSKLGELVDGRYRIVSQPPLVVPLRDLQATYGLSSAQVERAVRQQFRGYRATLDDARRHLLERFQFVDAARKVVGVGSVGTRAYIVLLQGRDQQDPLFLQVKEAAASVLEDHLPKSRYRSRGERVVRGQRLMQAASDIFLGWFTGPDGRHYYWRQLRDMKGSATVEAMSPRSLTGTRTSARGRWPGRTPGPVTRSRSRPTWVPATSSTARSRTSPNGTRTRTNATMRPSLARSGPDGSRPSKEFDHRPMALGHATPAGAGRRLPWATTPRSRSAGRGSAMRRPGPCWSAPTIPLGCSPCPTASSPSSSRCWSWRFTSPNSARASRWLMRCERSGRRSTRS